MSRFLEIYHDGDEAILTESISFADAAKASYGLLRKLWETIKTMLRQFIRFVKRIIYKIKGTNPVRIGPLIFDYSAFANGGFGRYESTGRMWNAVQDNFSKFTDQFAQADCDRKALIAEHENIISETRDMQNNMTSTMKICEFSSAEAGYRVLLSVVQRASAVCLEGDLKLAVALSVVYCQHAADCRYVVVLCEHAVVQRVREAVAACTDECLAAAEAVLSAFAFRESVTAGCHLVVPESLAVVLLLAVR